MTEEPHRKVDLPFQASDVIITIGGRERPRLARIVGVIVAPIVSWWLRRRPPKRSDRDRTA